MPVPNRRRGLSDEVQSVGWRDRARARCGYGAGAGDGDGEEEAETVEVCKHGCDFRTIQDAVDHTGKKAVINVHPGKYREGVVFSGHKHDGVTIQGTKKNPKKVVLQGKHAKDPEGQPANNGIETIGVDGVRVKNLTGDQLPRQRDPLRRLRRLPGEERPRLVQPRLRDLRLQLHRRPDDEVGRLGPGRLRLLRRRDAVPEQAGVDAARPPRRPTRTCSATPARTPST